MSVYVETASTQDVPAWLELVCLLSDHYPGLDLNAYRQTLEKNIARGTALCVRGEGRLSGFLLFSPRQHVLSCMGVHPHDRRTGVATALVQEMLRRLPEGDITVTTFQEGDPLGTAARAFYQSLGFEPDALVEEFGYPVQWFVLRRPRATAPALKNGTIWLDDQGQPIQAHGGMITRFGDTYYWYGENKNGETNPVLKRIDVVGVSCYSSKDLRVWHNEGVVLPACPDDPTSPLHPSQVLERPKVLYCRKTGKYVMWFHADSADYTFAAAGCAVADSPTGPFTFLYAKQPNRRDCRDMTLFEAPDGHAYLVHSGDWNKTLYFSELTEDYLDFTGVCYPAMADQEREAPALFYRDGLYYCVTSGCTGWAPNSALYAVARHLSNGMKLIDNPCTGPNARKTFYGQSSCIFEVNAQAYILLDHWQPQNLRMSGYSILPVYVDGLFMEIPWQDTFSGLK